MAKNVTVIPARIQRTQAAVQEKRKVAGYARVSTDMDEQATSYEAQVDYYTNYIKSRTDWEFAGMYSDEGISATNTRLRTGFNQMIEDALDGKIDLIITKSVSRFARNTVDSLTTVRKLKEKGVEIFFEKENIWTLDSKGELLITIMSSLAQEESRSISENTMWGQRKRFADGKGSLAYSRFLGYDKDFKINEEQAETVRLIFKLFLAGYTCSYIAKKLMELGKAAPSGKDKWYANGVRCILKNEKYKGDALLQKHYTADFLSKKKVVNKGEVPQYYVKDHHEAIIDKGVFDYVQAELERRKQYKYRSDCVFSGRIRCGECGGVYGRRTWHSTDKYKREVWQCNNKYKKDHDRCKTRHVTIDEIKEGFIEELNRIWHKKNDVIANARILQEMAANPIDLIEELDRLTDELRRLESKLEIKGAVTDRDYALKYEKLVEKYHQKNDRAKELRMEIERSKAGAVKIKDYIDQLEKLKKPITEFDEDLWVSMIDEVVVQPSGKLEYRFRG